MRALISIYFYSHRQNNKTRNHPWTNKRAHIYTAETSTSRYALMLSTKLTKHVKTMFLHMTYRIFPP